MQDYKQILAQELAECGDAADLKQLYHTVSKAALRGIQPAWERQDDRAHASGSFARDAGSSPGAGADKIPSGFSISGGQAAPKQACYFSAEFLLGRVVYANLYNLGLLEDMRQVFGEKGLDANMFESVDDDALGNGGLGRLAACFLDSAATCGYRLDGYGIRYRYGLFKQ